MERCNKCTCTLRCIQIQNLKCLYAQFQDGTGAANAARHGAKSASSKGVGAGAGAPLTKLQQLQQLQQRKLRIASIFQHYYPEGGWGLAVLGCGAAATALAHGAQLAASGALTAAAWRRWGREDFTDTGRTPPSTAPSPGFFFPAKF